jgi:hypothetical protein
MSNPPNPLLLPTSADELSNPQTSRRALTAEQLNDIRHLLDGARTPSMQSAATSFKGRRALVPVTSKAVFEGTLEPIVAADGKERFVVHVGDGKFKEMTREDAHHQLFDSKCNYVSVDDSSSKQSSEAGKSSSKAIHANNTSKQTKSALRTKNIQAQVAPSAPDGDSGRMGCI